MIENFFEMQYPALLETLTRLRNGRQAVVTLKIFKKSLSLGHLREFVTANVSNQANKNEIVETNIEKKLMIFDQVTSVKTTHRKSYSELVFASFQLPQFAASEDSYGISTYQIIIF